ncbi:hypothetical protein FKM82_030623 [Ascaphus truei]
MSEGPEYSKAYGLRWTFRSMDPRSYIAADIVLGAVYFCLFVHGARDTWSTGSEASGMTVMMTLLGK